MAKPKSPKPPKTARDVIIRGTLELPPDPARRDVVIIGTMDLAETPPEPPTDHAYFDQLVAMPECRKNFSLRDPAQLAADSDGGYAMTDDRPLVWTYDPAADPDPRKQDAAKGVILAKHNSCQNQVRLPLPDPYGATLLVTWDTWFGDEWRYQNAGLESYKTWQLASPKESIWTEVRTRFKLAAQEDRPDAVAKIDVRFYGNVGKQLGEGVTDNEPLSPQAGAFYVMPERWTRFWVFWEPTDDPDFRLFSLWVADAQTDPVQVYAQLPMKPNKPDGGTRWNEFWLEYNTSQESTVESRTDLVSYCRNVAMLVGVTDVAPLLQKPTP